MCPGCFEQQAWPGGLTQVSPGPLPVLPCPCCGAFTMQGTPRGHLQGAGWHLGWVQLPGCHSVDTAGGDTAPLPALKCQADCGFGLRCWPGPALDQHLPARREGCGGAAAAVAIPVVLRLLSPYLLWHQPLASAPTLLPQHTSTISWQSGPCTRSSREGAPEGSAFPARSPGLDTSAQGGRAPAQLPSGATTTAPRWVTAKQTAGLVSPDLFRAGRCIGAGAHGPQLLSAPFSPSLAAGLPQGQPQGSEG